MESGKQFSSILKKVIFWIIVLIIFFFLGKNLVQTWQEIPFDKLKFNLGFILISFIPIFLNFLYGAYLWQKILANLGEKISFKYSLSTTGISVLGKYLPGKVWFAAGRVYFIKKLGVKEEKGFLSIALETGLLLLSSLIIFIISPLIYNYAILRNYIFLAIILTILAIIALHPFFAGKIINIICRLLKRPFVDLRYRYFSMLALTLLFGIVWINYGIGFFFLINSFYPVSCSKFIDLTGVFSISWNLGFIALFAPAGLGVREGILTLLLSLYFPKPIAIIISLLSRLWITVAEILFAAISIKFLPWQISKSINLGNSQE
ncbi:MAG: lysylphosphatidylglycerol synthase domain-containing protein [candidate division WOR-3 bacterium]